MCIFVRFLGIVPVRQLSLRRSSEPLPFLRYPIRSISRGISPVRKLWLRSSFSRAVRLARPFPSSPPRDMHASLAR